jgi:hypothetical protein
MQMHSRGGFQLVDIIMHTRAHKQIISGGDYKSLRAAPASEKAGGTTLAAICIRGYYFMWKAKGSAGVLIHLFRREVCVNPFCSPRPNAHHGCGDNILQLEWPQSIEIITPRQLTELELIFRATHFLWANGADMCVCFLFEWLVGPSTVCQLWCGWNIWTCLTRSC